MAQYNNNNVQMPLFASASGMTASSAQHQNSFWGDVDHLDVDILAEYLLDDIGTNPSGVSFDFPYVVIYSVTMQHFTSSDL
jgi:hypothetical protein